MMRPLTPAVFTALWMLASFAAGVAHAEFEADQSSEPVGAAGNPMFKMAGEYLAAGEPDKARPLIEKLLEDKPDDPHAQLMLAMVMVEQGAYDQGRAMFERLIEENPENHVMLNNYAWLLATSDHRGFRDPKEALVLAQKAVLTAPNSYPVWSTLAEAHFINGNFARAVEVMKNCFDMAQKANAPQETLKTYKQQSAKMRKANNVMRLLE